MKILKGIAIILGLIMMLPGILLYYFIMLIVNIVTFIAFSTLEFLDKIKR